MKALEESSALATDTVFSVSMINRVNPDGAIPNMEALDKVGVSGVSQCKSQFGIRQTEGGRLKK